SLKRAFSDRVIPSLLRGLMGASNVGVSSGQLLKTLFVALLPAIFFFALMGALYSVVTAPIKVEETAGLQAMGIGMDAPAEEIDEEAEEELLEITATPAPAEQKEEAAPEAATPAAEQPPAERQPAPNWYWWMLGIGGALLVAFYLFFNWVRLEVFKMLLGSFFPLAVLILAVLGSIVFGLATPTEAAAVGGIGGAVLAAAYRRLNYQVVKESVFLTGKTSAMVCWLFVGSSIFSAAFALLGGQELVEKWVLGLGLTPVQFLILSQVIIFLLGWPLEWTEIIVIFMPIFVPLLDNFGIDPLFFGLLVALNLQTAFLSPPVAMSAFYLKGVAPSHVTLNQIFAGMLPFMGIQVFAVVLLYVFPAIGLWLPTVLYR
ncbi:MAG: TRAP transporter large permease subunit, partial [Burkholderiaceae bacterium]|nr:TRAP transporter large permease subunit [Burkholderiaceae bacterium]